MLRRMIKGIVLLVPFGFFLTAAAVVPQSNFIQVKDSHFVLDGKPYYFSGTNLWYGCYLGSTGQTGNRDRLLRELDRLSACGIDNLRILGGSEKSALSTVIKPAIQTAPGVYNDSLLIGLDFLLSEMSKRKMHAVVFLNNYWNWSGGMAQYNAWFGGGSAFDVSSFYSNARANAGFRKFIFNIINRKNTVSGLYYYEDPAIMAWELANEPRPGYNPSTVNSFYQWIDSTAQYIHSLDPNHLVTTGNEGTMGSSNSEAVYLKAHQSQAIDYATIHVWALNWGWFDPNRIAQTYPSALSKAIAYIQQHINSARQLNKPLTMEEFGLPRDNQRNDIGSPTTARDDYYRALLKTVYDSAAAGSPIAGSNFWGWGGEGRSPNTDYVWRAGDPFVCDPPMEKQGLNSVFDADSSTLNILKAHSALMIGLRQTSGVARNLIAVGFELYPNYPNPFNPSTRIRFSVHTSGRVILKVFDLLGKEIATPVDEYRTKGMHEIAFNGSSLPSGMYFYRLSVGGCCSENKKMILIK